jgi:hypothetical protein
MLVVAGVLVAAGTPGCSRTAQQAADADASADGQPAGAAGTDAAAGTGGSGRPGSWFGGGATPSSRDAFVKLEQALQEANGAIDEGDYDQIGQKVVAARAALVQAERAFAAGVLPPAQAAEANRAVMELTTACGHVERAIRSGAAVSDVELEAFRGRAKAALAVLERLAK